MSDIEREHPGAEQYREALRTTPLSKFPWGTLVKNIALVGGAHTLGYYGAGGLMAAIQHTPLGPRFNRLSDPIRRAALQHIGGTAMSVGASAAGLAHLSGQLRVAEELARIERDKNSAEKRGSVKVASLLGTYAALIQAQR